MDVDTQLAMNPSEFADVIERLLIRLEGGRSATVSSRAERVNIRSVVGAWFGEYRSAFLQMIGDEQLLAPMDGLLQEILRRASETSARRTVTRDVRSTRRYFNDNLLVPLSRAYWSRAPQQSPAGFDREAESRLRQLDADLADSYAQAVYDVEDEARLSYRGPAAELRELLTGALHILAPTERVQAMDWYREARRSGARSESTPTRAERVRFILRSRSQGSTQTETAETFMSSVEERLAGVVNSTYKRGSAAAHGGTERSEVQQLLQYINALLRELLPSGE